MGLFKRFCRDESGQFAIIFAVISTMLMMGVMVAVDVTKMTSVKAKVSAVTDAAALAGAEAYDDANRLQVVQAFLTANSEEVLPGRISGTPVINFDDATREVTVSVATTVDMHFAGMVGVKHKDVSYESVAVFPDRMDPLTIAFVLDISGSMGGTTSDGKVKLDALKSASEELFTVIEGKVKNPAVIEKYIRTSVSTFASTLSTETPMEWGFAGTRATIQGLNRSEERRVGKECC